MSVVICVYNGEQFLGATIQSALAQTYSAFELIVVDDGSTDGSAAVLRQFNDPRIRLIRQSHGGGAAALAKGLEAANGTYIALLDQDDLWETDNLKVHIETLERERKTDLTFSWFRVIDERGVEIGLHSHRYRGTIDFEHLLRDFVIGGSSNVVIRRTAICQTGVDVDLRMMYDLDLFLRIALLAPNNIEAIPRDLMQYRRHSRQISRSAEPLKREWLRILEKFRALAPREVAHGEKYACSNMNRYFARLAYERSCYGTGLQLLREGFSNAPGAFLADSRNWLTGAACLTGLLAPKGLHRRLERMAGLRRI